MELAMSGNPNSHFAYIEVLVVVVAILALVWQVPRHFH